MIDILLELLMNRLGIFILGVILVLGGVYTWTTYRSEAAFYDAAVGSEGKTVTARVHSKNEETVRSDDAENDTTVGYLDLRFESEGREIDVKHYVDSDVFARYKDGDTVELRFHPANTQFVVLPETKRPSTLFASVMSIGLIVFGALIVLVVIISFF